MLTAIRLDNKFHFSANEIANVADNWLLPHELGSRELTIFEARPELALSVCLIDAQLA